MSRPAAPSAPATPASTKPAPPVLTYSGVAKKQATKLEQRALKLRGVASTAYYPDKTFEVYLKPHASAKQKAAITALVSKIQGKPAVVESPSASATD